MRGDVTGRVELELSCSGLKRYVARVYVWCVANDNKIIKVHACA